MPETDPNPAALIARVERLERLSGLGGKASVDEEVADRSTSGGASGTAAKAAGLSDAESGVVPAATKKPPKKESAPAKAAPAAPAAPQAPIPIASGSFDIEMLRKNWTTVIQHLKSQRQPMLVALLEIATPVSYDGETLELAFPPDRKFGVAKVEAKQAELQEALQALFGTAPKIRCVVRGEVTSASGSDAQIDEDDVPADDAEALARVQAALGAEVAPELDG
jgi:hypothetical protein